jgi:glycopeptide antibiotics resistance protein
MRSLTKLQKSALIAFSAYLLALVWVITLKCNMVQVVAESRYFVGQQSLTERFLRFTSSFYETTTSEFIVNILLFIPLGLSTPFLFEKSPYFITFFCGFAISLAFEISQLLNCIGGFTYIDIYCNTFGATLGAIMHFYIRDTVTEKQTETALKICALLAVAVSVFGAFNTAKCFDVYITDNPGKYL